MPFFQRLAQLGKKKKKKKKKKHFMFFFFCCCCFMFKHRYQVDRGLPSDRRTILIGRGPPHSYDLQSSEILDLNEIRASSRDFSTYHLGDCPSDGSGEPAHPAHLARAFAVRTHEVYGSRRKIRHLVPLDGCTCAFEE